MMMPDIFSVSENEHDYSLLSFNGEIAERNYTCSRLVYLFPENGVVVKIASHQNETELEVLDSIKAVDRRFFPELLYFEPEFFGEMSCLVEPLYDGLKGEDTSCNANDLLNYLSKKYMIADLHDGNWFEIDGLPMVFDFGFQFDQEGQFRDSCSRCGLSRWRNGHIHLAL